VEKAIAGIESEVFVVDNNSVDGSLGVVRDKFPFVKIIKNKENKGFSKANNQAINESAGEYVLLLNPDTVVQEDTFANCIQFMDDNKDAGSLGVKMIDGKGNFLPESKRSLPTPETAFYKVFGLSRLFPKSKRFGKYHLGYLDKDHTNEVEILPGAFMMIRKEALEKIGLLDEVFFMYGEDIDLSYRLIKAGYKNYYFPKTTIIHYKGESTKKGSINYVFMFYRAMIIFARKHFTKKNAKLFAFLIYMAIYFRASLSIIKRTISRISLPVADAVLIYSGFYLVADFWEKIKFDHTGVYPDEYFYIMLPVYILIWLTFLLFSGGYDKQVKINSLVKGILFGTGFILIIYALFPESWRFSRALIFLGTIWAFLSVAIIRLLLHLCNINGYKIGTKYKKRIIIVGNSEEARRIRSIINQIDLKIEIVGFVNPNPKEGLNEDFIGDIDQIKEIVTINKIDEIIFSSKQISAKHIIKKMLQLSSTKVNFKIAPPESLSIIGSNSINTSGDLYVINFNSIGKSKNRRNKRVFDIITSVVLFVFSPFLLFWVHNKGKYYINCFKVFLGFNTWVGFTESTINGNGKLPNIKKGILSPIDGLKKKEVSNDLIEKINLLYSKDYKIENDISIIFKGFKHLGR
jgi:GT2 family glycosyltransferase